MLRLTGLAGGSNDAFIESKQMAMSSICGLERVVEESFHPEVRLLRRKYPTFQVCGYTGLVLAIALAIIVIRHEDLSFWVLARIIAAAITTFFVLVMGTKILTGEERIIYYHHEIGVMVVSALLLWATRQPLLPYLDITILGIGTFLTFGRIGCLLVGCCHGRPSRWGVRYGDEHAAAGFPSYLVGVRLFPIQAVESFWVLCTVAVGTFFVWSGKAPGTALAWYVVTYDLGRFCFEFARGDADRSYWLGFSQPQWLSLFLTSGIVWAELAGALPVVRWHVAVFILLVAALAAVSMKRHIQATSEFQLLHPRHIKQVANALRSTSTSTERSAVWSHGQTTVVSIASTSLGIRISGSEAGSGEERMYHYTISAEKELTEQAAKLLARLIRRLKGAAGPQRLIAGSQGVFHLLVWAR